MKKLIFSFVISSFLLVNALASLAETLSPMATNSEAKFFVKIMNFNTSISSPKVGVVFDPSSSASASSKKRIMNALSNYGIDVVGVPVSAVEQAKGHGINIFYFSKGLSSLDHVARVARKSKIVTFSSESNDVEEGFASVTVGIASTGKTKILINLRNLKKEGSMFSSQLLRLANIVN